MARSMIRRQRRLRHRQLRKARKRSHENLSIDDAYGIDRHAEQGSRLLIWVIVISAAVIVTALGIGAVVLLANQSGW